MKTGYGSDEMLKDMTNVENTPSKNVEAERLIEKATKSASLPSEVQKTMSEILAERLKMSKQKTKDVEGLTDRLQKTNRQSADIINMGTTMVKDNEQLAKGRRLG
jgi:hypothetical protein